METMQPYYRLMKSILFVLFLSFWHDFMWERGSCFYLSNYKANGWLNYWSDRSDPTDPVVRSNNEQTVFMYLPWSNNLTSFFYQNIADLKSIIGNNILKNERVIVFICTRATKATLSELVYENGKSVQKTLKTTIIRILPIQPQRASLLFWTTTTYAPAKRYAMIIGCHGMGWIPVSRAVSRSSLQISKSTPGVWTCTDDTFFWRNTNEISNWYYYACRRYFERGPKDGIYTFRWLLYVYGRGCLWP